MQERDFGQVDEVQDFKSIPAGEYTVKIDEVRIGVTRDGSERWAMRLIVTDGDYAGRTAAWDGLTWSERGLPRIKFVLSRLGFDVAGRLALEPDDLIGHEAHVRLVEEERTDATTGQPVSRLKVPYTGWERVANGASTESGTSPST